MKSTQYTLIHLYYEICMKEMNSKKEDNFMVMNSYEQCYVVSNSIQYQNVMKQETYWNHHALSRAVVKFNTVSSFFINMGHYSM